MPAKGEWREDTDAAAVEQLLNEFPDRAFRSAVIGYLLWPDIPSTRRVQRTSVCLRHLRECGRVQKLREATWASINYQPRAEPTPQFTKDDIRRAENEVAPDWKSEARRTTDRLRAVFDQHPERTFRMSVLARLICPYDEYTGRYGAHVGQTLRHMVNRGEVEKVALGVYRRKRNESDD